MIRENTFEHKKKETGDKFNPGLGANRPLNNWALSYTRPTLRLKIKLQGIVKIWLTLLE